MPLSIHVHVQGILLPVNELTILFIYSFMYLLTYLRTFSQSPQLYDLRKFERENVVPYFGAGLRT